MDWLNVMEYAPALKLTFVILAGDTGLDASVDTVRPVALFDKLAKPSMADCDQLPDTVATITLFKVG